MPPDLREDVGRRRISQPAREVPEMSSLPPAAQRPPVRANERFQAHAANLLGHDTEAIFTYLHRTAPETDTAADTAERRALDLCLRPFALREPLDVMVEGCTEVGGAYAGKALGLWRIADLPHLPRMTG